MQFKLKLGIICLCLLWGQALAQDVRPEFPEDFPKATTEAAPTTTEATTTTQLPTTTAATSTTEAFPELAVDTTTTAATTKRPATTTQRTPTTKKPPVATTQRTPPTRPTQLPPFTTWQPYYPTYAAPTRPPHFTPAYHWLWDLEESDEQRCYLRDQVERGRARWSCGFTSSTAITSCYRCCYYGSSRFAGCSKLHSGRCNSVSSNWHM